MPNQASFTSNISNSRMTTIGIQFNFTDDSDLRPWMRRKSFDNVRVDSAHLSIPFTDRELAQPDSIGRVRFDLLRHALRKFTPASEYTIVYSFIPAPLELERSSGAAWWSGGSESSRVLPQSELTDDTEILLNFTAVDLHPAVVEMLREAPQYPLLNQLYSTLSGRDFASKQVCGLELLFDDRVETGLDHHLFRLGVWLEGDA